MVKFYMFSNEEEQPEMKKAKNITGFVARLPGMCDSLYIFFTVVDLPASNTTKVELLEFHIS